MPAKFRQRKVIADEKNGYDERESFLSRILQRSLLLRMPTLRRIGFAIATTADGRAARLKSIDLFFRHPAILGVLGFVFTVLIAQWLSSKYEENRRERDSVVRSMDGLRSAIDDVSVSFNNYELHAMNLIDSIEEGQPSGVISSARIDYTAAYYKWQERLAVNAPNIKQQYPTITQEANTINIQTMMQMMRTGTEDLNACVRNHLIVAREQADKEFIVECLPNYYSGGEKVEFSTRMKKLSDCVSTFVLSMWPDPKDDFGNHSPSVLPVLHVCDERELLTPEKFAR